MVSLSFASLQTPMTTSKIFTKVIPILRKSLDLKSEGEGGVPVADSGTGAIAKELFELSRIHNLIWCTCVDPSVEMQEVA